MFFYLSKILSFLFEPLTWVIIMLMINGDKENNRLAFRDNVDRIMQAYSLYEKGKIKKTALMMNSLSFVCFIFY